MTVSTEVDHNEYTGNGVTTTFPYTFRIFHKSDLVIQVVDLDENITDLVLDTDYTVTGAGGYTGGNVILTTALENGFRISIARELPVTQETDLRNQGKFFAEVHEDAFDKLTMLIQQAISWLRLSLRKPSFVANYYDAQNNYIRNLRDPSRPQDAATKNYVDTLASGNLNRALRVPEAFIPSLPDVDGRRNKTLSFDSAGNPLLLDPAGSGLWGYVLIDSFQAGAKISTRYDALHWPLPDGDGEYYRWDGALPKSVPAGSTPASTGGVGVGAWVGVGDAALRSDLTDLISFVPDNPHEKLNNAYEDKSTLSVSTWNIQSYQVIASRYGRNITSPQRFFDLSSFVCQSAPHIICMQEAYDGPSAHMSNLAVDPYVDESFGYGSVNTDTINLMVGYRAGNSTLSAYPLSENKVIRVTDEGTYIRLASRDTLNHPIIGKIAIYNVHGSWFEAAAMQLYSDIISDYKALGVTKVIVIGDFNHDTSVDWFSPLTDDGFTIVNNMNYDTRNDGSGSWYVDNIIIKGFLVQDVFVTTPEQSLSDHKMLTAIIKAE